MYGGRCLWQVFTASLWIFIESSASTEVTPTVNIRYAPPSLELLLPTTDSNIGSVDFRFGLDGLLSKEFSAPGSLSGQGWKYSTSNQSISDAELVWAYAVIYDANGHPAEETWYTTAYAEHGHDDDDDHLHRVTLNDYCQHLITIIVLPSSKPSPLMSSPSPLLSSSCFDHEYIISLSS
ncbi:hypothetical protein PoB_001534700 [Plakobranchus ocellatus]|uniref:Uncharacterized protein n=1 Tax=Plakobranchus ocellatus TaxID=259542 RepID=A0AAV3Z2T0_9GAST|nr:hypothetical protein PoB_001534700 [Plakobranchus ocellatus]